MGNAGSTAPRSGRATLPPLDAPDEPYATPTGSYPAAKCGWSLPEVARMIRDGQLAPRVRGLDEDAAATVAGGTRECPICLQAFASFAVNTTLCCKADVCSECFLHCQTAAYDVTCPFCKVARFRVVYHGDPSPLLALTAAGVEPPPHRRDSVLGGGGVLGGGHGGTMRVASPDQSRHSEQQRRSPAGAAPPLPLPAPSPSTTGSLRLAPLAPRSPASPPPLSPADEGTKARLTEAGVVFASVQDRDDLAREVQGLRPLMLPPARYGEPPRHGLPPLASPGTVRLPLAIPPSPLVAAPGAAPAVPMPPLTGTAAATAPLEADFFTPDDAAAAAPSPGWHMPVLLSGSPGSSASPAGDAGFGGLASVSEGRGSSGSPLRSPPLPPTEAVASPTSLSSSFGSFLFRRSRSSARVTSEGAAGAATSPSSGLEASTYHSPGDAAAAAVAAAEEEGLAASEGGSGRRRARSRSLSRLFSRRSRGASASLAAAPSSTTAAEDAATQNDLLKLMLSTVVASGGALDGSALVEEVLTRRALQNSVSSSHDSSSGGSAAARNRLSLPALSSRRSRGPDSFGDVTASSPRDAALQRPRNATLSSPRSLPAMPGPSSSDTAAPAPWLPPRSPAGGSSSIGGGAGGGDDDVTDAERTILELTLRLSQLEK